MTFRESREWHRVALWGGSLVFGYLPFADPAGPTHDPVRLVICGVGALLLALSGFLLRTYRIEFDTQRRCVVLHARRPGSRSRRSVPFDEIEAVLVARTTQRDEDLLPANRNVARWRVALRCAGETLTVTHNPFVHRSEARALAEEVGRLVGAPVDDRAA